MGDLVQFPTKKAKNYDLLGDMVEVLLDFDLGPESDATKAHIVGILEGYVMCSIHTGLITTAVIKNQEDAMQKLITAWIARPDLLEHPTGLGILNTILYLRDLYMHQTEETPTNE